jgi:hypothetical protein
MVELSRKQRERLMFGTEEVDVNGAGLGDVIVVSVGHDDADLSLAAGQVTSVSDDANNWPPENLGHGLDAVDRGEIVAAAVFEAIPKSQPNHVFERDGLLRAYDLPPGALALDDIHGPFDPAQDMVFGVEDLADEPAGAVASGVIGNGDRKVAAGVCGRGLLSRGNSCGDNEGERQQKMLRRKGTAEVHVGSPCHRAACPPGNAV